MNRGARTLQRKLSNGTIDDLAAKLEIDRTYCGRILSDKRRPGLALRTKARELFGIPLHHWDEDAPDPDQSADKPAA